MKYTPKFRSRQTLVALLAIAAACPLVQAGEAGIGNGNKGPVGGAGTGGAYMDSDIVRRAMTRRQEKTVEAMDALQKGRELYNEGKYAEAKLEFEKTLALIPNAPLTADRRAFAIQHVVDVNLALAYEYRRTGRYDEARTLLENVLKVQPENEDALRELEYLSDPIRTNPALTPQYVSNVKQVNADLRMGNGFYELGEYDKADEQFNKVLRIDPYNVAARRFKEKINNEKMEYYSSAYDQTRANMLMQVMQAWETPVPNDIVAVPDAGTTNQRQDMGGAAILSKLRNTRISVNFENISLEEAIDFLRSRSRQLTTEGEQGLNFVIRGGPAEGEGSLKNMQVRELKLTNVPMLEVLKFLTESLGLRYKIDNYAVVIMPSGGSAGEDVFTRTFKVPPSFRKELEAMAGGAGGGAAAADADPFASAGDAAPAAAPRMGIQEMLAKQGVSFGEGTSCIFVPQSQTLIVKNSAGNLDQIEQLINQIALQVPQQVTIQTKFVEVSQENTEELSFDWVLGATNLGGGNWMGGGNNGTGTPPRLGQDFNMTPGVPGTNVSQLSPTSAVNGIMTSGNRTGDGAITRDTVSSLLNNPNRQTKQDTTAPGILSFTGIYNDLSFQVMMRGLSQKRGVDLLTAPSITSGKSGSTAKIEIIREFFYPESYLPPEIPNNVGNNNGNNNNGGGGGGLLGGQAQVQSFPVTPATPESFVPKELGISLEITPEYSADSDVIELKFIPSIVEFEGFINYGSPIQAAAIDGLGNPMTVTITENRIEQPVFSRRKVECDLSIYDGHTVGIGGLISESVQRVEDKVPILGDLPLVGRLFRSEADNHIKSNLIIFVTAKKIDATGRPISKAAATASVPEALAPTAETASSADGALLPDLN